METEGPRASTEHKAVRMEMRRRLWYSMYVLDRLLALQLGRPPAIHDEDNHVRLPSRTDEADFDWAGDAIPPAAEDSPSTGDYFVSVIKFSRLVGLVLRDLYSPIRTTSAAEELLRTSNLDRQLLEWKLSLPRTLRFDLGHTFERSITYKRQVIKARDRLGKIKL